MKHCEISCCLWIVFLVFPLSICAQRTPTPLDDLAYVIEVESEEDRVQQALYNFQQETGIPFIVAIVYEDHPYAVSVQEHHHHWLQRQEHGVSLIVTVAQETKTYRKSDLQVSSALANELTLSERQQIMQEVVEPIFKGHPVPHEACTRGLLAGIKAIQSALQQNDYSTKMLVKEVLLTMQEEHKLAVDSLRKNLEIQRKAYYQIIDDNHWLRWMYAGKDGIFIREGISQDEKINKQAQPFLGLTIQPEDRKKYDEAKLQLFDQWASIYRGDKILLHILAKDALVKDLLEEEPLKAFEEQIQGQVQEGHLEDITAKFKQIETSVRQHIENELLSEINGQKK